MADTAALIENLDLLITVDTSVCHLAGALAKPVWVMITAIPHWGWGLNSETTPWYPTMRLFRQDKPDEWEPVIERVKVALRHKRSNDVSF
jgi:ADP-heptose:LPS heptosyltransferase